jgi:hypothetical protein
VIEEIKSFLESNKNENTTFQNMWAIAKVVLRGKFIATSAYIKKNRHYSAAHGYFSKIDHILVTKQVSINIRKLK